MAASSHSRTVFPLNEAYEFAYKHRLAKEIADIQNQAKSEEIVTSPSKRLRDRGSSIRRGMCIELFENRGLLSDFLDEYWRVGKTSSGQTKMRRYLGMAQEYRELFG